DALPDGSRPELAEPGPVTSVLFSAEDGASNTIRPRAAAAGADLNRLALPKFAGRTPRFPDDLPDLVELVAAVRAGLVVFDPLSAFLPPRVAMNLDQCVRQVLTP